MQAAFVTSQHASHVMVQANRGRIAHLSSWAAQQDIGNALYGVAKAATDKRAADPKDVTPRNSKT